MTKPFTFNVHGTPRPLPRGRWVKGRLVSIVDPKAKLWRLAVDRAVREAIANSGRAVPLFRDAVKLRAVFAFEPPKGQERRLDYPHTQTPDASNLLKLIEDVMESAGVFKNDSQVTHPEPEKWWGKRAGVSVTVQCVEGVRRAVPSAVCEGEAPGWMLGCGSATED